MTKHTPGPWRCEVEKWEEVWSVREDVANYGFVAVLKGGGHWVDKVQLEANAHLIAAAPELLEALERTHEVLLAASHNVYESSQLYLDATAALAKARGES